MTAPRYTKDILALSIPNYVEEMRLGTVSSFTLPGTHSAKIFVKVVQVLELPGGQFGRVTLEQVAV